MARRRSVLLLLVAALSALALSVGVGAKAPAEVRAEAGREAAVGRERAPGLDGAFVRGRLDEPRSAIGGQRSSKADLALFAVLGVLALMPWLVSRRASPQSSSVVVPVAWRSPIKGRAPPKLQLAVS